MSNLSLTKSNEQSIHIPFSTENWYRSLIDDCQAIVTEGEFTARWALVEAYHELGTRIIQDYDKIQNVDRFVQGVADDIQRSKRTVYYALQFAQKYPELDKLPGGKAVSWRKVVHEYLGGEKSEPKPKIITCPQCLHQFEL